MERLSHKMTTFFAFATAFLCTAVASANDTDFFEKRIRPVLIEKCFPCHSSQAGELKGGLLLDSAEGFKRGGESGLPAQSRLIEAIRRENPEFQMPPDEALAPKVIADFETWILSGGVFPQNSAPGNAEGHWAFKSLQTPTSPPVKNAAWGITAVDAFILAKLEEAGLAPSPEADKRTLIRRVHYDLLGLPPSPEGVEAFASDTNADAYEKMVERCLSSPHYGERWARHWMDVARYADTKGYIYDGREEGRFTHSHVYRDWLVDALNNDMPYDDFIRMQLAADFYTDKDTQDNLAAMGFLTLGQRFLGVVPDIIDDRIDTVTRGLLGLTVSCARCHDHKFDPIPIEDYYSLYGVFSASSERIVPLNPKDLEDEKYAAFNAELKVKQDNLKTVFARKCDELEARLRLQVDRYLAAVPTANTLPTDDFYQILNAEDLNPTVVRRWADYISRQGNDDPVFGLWNTIVSGNEFIIGEYIASHPEINAVLLKAVSDSAPQNLENLIAVYGKVFKSINEEWLGNLKEAECGGKPLPEYLSDPAKEEIRLHLYANDSPLMVPDAAIVDVEWMFDEPTRVELGGLNAKIEEWIVTADSAPKFAGILVDKKEMPTPRVFNRGNPANPGVEVPRRFLALIEGETRTAFPNGSGLRDLAEAIVRPDNPLTARVIVNRVWAWHFGKGLVGTPSDFGTRSDKPTHPELLDYLAAEFMESGWTLKQLHRKILLSATYRQASNQSNAEHAQSIDPENKLLWRFNGRRLDFESIRDSILIASGEADLTMGGRPVDLLNSPYSKRRTLYGKIDRRYLDQVYRVFDFPNPDMHNPKRIDTTSPQQALFLLNNPFVQEMARAFAAKARAFANITDGERINLMYRRAYQRPASVEECAEALRFMDKAKASVTVPPPPIPPSAWTYGYGKINEQTGMLESFTPLPHFTGTAWQGSEDWPGGATGWAQITALGGHPGNDLAHAIVRRWTASVSGKIDIEGRIKHESSDGDGIRARILSSRQGQLGILFAHNSEVDCNFYSVNVESGDTIDFIVDINKVLNHDEHLWAPTITFQNSDNTVSWNSEKEFAGPPVEPITPLNEWEKFAQVLLSSNEFLFVE